MLFGAIIGDIVGSVFEFANVKTKKFTLFSPHSAITDDSCMTVAVAEAIRRWTRDGGDLSDIAAATMREFGNKFPDLGYGAQFYQWLIHNDKGAYNSWGNGAAMRISAAGWYGKDLNEVKYLSYIVTSVTHNHIEGIKGAEATAVAIWAARNGWSKDDIAEYIRDNYYNSCDCVADLQADYEWDASCQGTVPPALQCFFESENFEDAIRNAISIGGDSDTIGAITGSVAEAYYGVPDELKQQAIARIPDGLLQVVLELEESAPTVTTPAE